MRERRVKDRWRAAWVAVACLGAVACADVDEPAGRPSAPSSAQASAQASARSSGQPRATATTPSTRRPTTSVPDAGRSAVLGALLRGAVAAERFADVLDLATGVRTARSPNLDAAVIELDAAGRPVAAADVLLSAAYPRGVSVPLDPAMAASSVRWRVWNGARWSAGRPGTEDLVRPRPGTRHDFIAPYPASMFKLMVAFGVLRLVDRGVLRLDDRYAFRSSGGCPDASGSGTRTIRALLDAMLSVSDNWSTCALLKRLHEARAVGVLNATLRSLGLGTLQLRGTAADGGHWDRRGITMTAMDTARLLLLVSGAPGALWRMGGRPVTARVLSPTSRGVFLGMLRDQGLNQVLSTANWCGRGYPAAGIPHRVPARWMTPTGRVRVPDRVFGTDVRPCNARAEVTFAHKTGLVDVAGADAGIVTSLPGAPPRRYVVAVFSTLGCGYGDAGRAAACEQPGVHYTERLARLGARIDRMLVRR